MKFENIVPVYYWPTVVYLVDDNKVFLKKIEKALSKNFNVLASINPGDCINTVNAQEDMAVPEHFFIKTEDEENESVQIIEEDFSKILQKKNDKNKEKIISVIVMDYNLPQDTGVNYIKKIENKLVQKILLTGYAKPQEVIEAFNNRNIDIYIGKDEKDVVDNLIKHIECLQCQYFENITRPLINQDKELLNILSNENFKHVFNKVVSKNKIKELYLLNNLGTYLLINENNEKLVFLATTKSHVDDLKLFFDSDEPSIQPLIKDILNYKKIPFFYGTKSVVATKDWGSYCFNCQTVPNTDILYSLITDLSKYGF